MFYRAPKISMYVFIHILYYNLRLWFQFISIQLVSFQFRSGALYGHYVTRWGYSEFPHTSVVTTIFSHGYYTQACKISDKGNIFKLGIEWTKGRKNVRFPTAISQKRW